MDSLQIQTGEKRIAINGDESRVIVFNPSDTLFAERFYKLIGEFENRLTEYQQRGIELEADSTPNGNGMPANMGARLELIKEACEYSRESIDKVFGEGTSQIVFGDVLSLDAIQQFFSGITPFIQTTRAEKIAPYLVKKSVNGSGRKRKK
jgi:hypothetical protein